MKPSDLITIDPDILGGTPVFSGTRVPVQTLFQYLESNYALDEFLECFPTVSHDAAVAVLEFDVRILPGNGVTNRETTQQRIHEVTHLCFVPNKGALDFGDGNLTLGDPREDDGNGVLVD